LTRGTAAPTLDSGYAQAYAAKRREGQRSDWDSAFSAAPFRGPESLYKSSWIPLAGLETELSVPSWPRQPILAHTQTRRRILVRGGCHPRRWPRESCAERYDGAISRLWTDGRIE
jgi:hypothetical protein